MGDITTPCVRGLIDSNCGNHLGHMLVSKSLRQTYPRIHACKYIESPTIAIAAIPELRVSPNEGYMIQVRTIVYLIGNLLMLTLGLLAERPTWRGNADGNSITTW